MPKKRKPPDLFRFNLSRKPLPGTKDKGFWIGVDLSPDVYDPTPELTKAIDRGGWPEGIKHIRKKLRI